MIASCIQHFKKMLDKTEGGILMKRYRQRLTDHNFPGTSDGVLGRRRHRISPEVLISGQSFLSFTNSTIRRIFQRAIHRKLLSQIAR